MPTLAPKLPWQHPFAGGYPRRGGQPLPTDPDAIDYLNRVAAADGAAVEVGIAQAIDSFVRGCKADSAGYAGDPTRSNWDAIQASCIMCGARTLSGALVPLKGTAPTPYNFASGDYSRSGATPGLKGNGIDKYLDTNRLNNVDPQNDNHLAVYATVAATTGNSAYAGELGTVKLLYEGGATFYARANASSYTTVAGGNVAGFLGAARSDSSSQTVRANGTTTSQAVPSAAPSSQRLTVFSRLTSLYSPARLAFYSVGSSLSLSALDARVSTLVSQIAAAIP